jgi:predicted ArsR family transcriptional regulator
VSRRSEVLRTLRAAPRPMSITGIAEELGVHPNTARFHLEHLVAQGQVEQVESERAGPGRPPLMFRALRRMDRDGPREYLLLAQVLAERLAGELNSSEKAAEAGRAWGRRAAAPNTVGGAEESVEHLVAMLDGMGFAPERSGDTDQPRIGLRHCPFLELAEQHSTVVCPVHLGLMQGALESWGAPVAVDRLEPFVEPDLCMTHLSLTSHER